MTTTERRIIDDYLTRRRSYIAFGFIIHLILTTASWWLGKTVVIGLFGGSSLILMFELQRNGSAITRTMLSLPMTADQLARSWRFVAFTFPVILFLIALLLGAVIGLVFGARYLTTEFFFLTAISQTLFLGVLYFILTGLPGQSKTGASIWQHFKNFVFNLLWGLSLPATIFVALTTPRHFEDLARGQVIAGMLMAVVSIVAWYRAGVLVREQATRPESGVGKAEKRSPTLSAREWQRFGAMPYFCLRFGFLTLALMMAILLIQRFASGWITSSTTSQMGFVKSQIGMMAIMSVFVTLSNLLGQLRALRTMPIRTSALAHWLTFWPLILPMILWLLAHLVLSWLDGTPVEWHLLRNSVLGVVSMGILMPLTLRFGLRVWAILPVMTFAAFIASAGHLLVSGFSEIHWAWLLAGLAPVLIATWCSTYWLLGTPHPWRANAMKGLMAARRM